MTMRLGVEAALLDGTLVPGDVVIDPDEGKVVSVGSEPPGSGGLAVPGFIDVQTNGTAGVDFTDADVDAYRAVAEALVTTGVTSYQPTLISLPEPTYLGALGRLQTARRELPAPRILGAHLEGPFLSRERPGAHDPESMTEPDLDLARRLLAAGPVNYMTLAPERPGALELISFLVDHNVVVALGHSDADAATAHTAFELGARAVTHLFNAQRPFHHREPGVGVAGLVHPDVTLTLIVDGIHLHPDAVMLAFAAASGRCALITDSIAAAGRGDGVFRLGNITVHVRGSEARLEDGTLAGSVLSMDQAVRNLIDLGLPLAGAVAAATTVPARLIGKPELGTLAPGTPADVAILDGQHRVTRTLVAGRETFAA
jgi:N-acetylglucosamine-6-phosphate deacetylase